MEFVNFVAIFLRINNLLFGNLFIKLISFDILSLKKTGYF